MNEKKQFGLATANKSRRFLRLRRTTGIAHSATRFPEVVLIKSLSQEDKIKLYQRIEVVQGIRIPDGKTTDLSPDANRILIKYKHLPSQRKKRYADYVKSILYRSRIHAIKTD